MVEWIQANPVGHGSIIAQMADFVIAKGAKLLTEYANLVATPLLGWLFAKQPRGQSALFDPDIGPVRECATSSTKTRCSQAFRPLEIGHARSYPTFQFGLDLQGNSLAGMRGKPRHTLDRDSNHPFVVNRRFAEWAEQLRAVQQRPVRHRSINLLCPLPRPFDRIFVGLPRTG